MSLHGKVAIVTGAAQGIGRAIAESLAQAGADIVVADLDPSRSKDTVAAVEQLGRKALNVKVNVADATDTKAMVDQVLKEWGKVDILVNNAGITKDGLLMRMSEDAWDAVMDINLKGVFLCSREAIKDMTRQRYGRIINITSVAAFMGNPGQANYSASKAGIVGFTKTVAREYAVRGVTVNAVAPGFIETAMTDVLPVNIKDEMKKLIPLGRFGTVNDVAQAVVFLASPDAGYITGQVIHVNGGMYM